jgi:tRNA (adenine22-N1)-methyltransferase
LLKGRLEALLELVVQPCRLLADVGTDHALVPAHAVLRGLAERALAVDLRVEPLRAAARNLVALGVSDRVRLLEGDGLAALAGSNVDVVVLAGLSGASFIRWWEAAPEVVRGLDRLIVQPNGQLEDVRRHAHVQGLSLLDENIRLEGGRHFITCAFGPRTSETDPAYDRAGLPLEQAFELGPLLFAGRDPLALDYYAQQVRRLSPLVAIGRSEHAPTLAAFERGLAGP